MNAVAPLTGEQVRAYARDGYLLLGSEFLAPDVLAEVKGAVPMMLAEDGPRRVLERDGRTVRSVYGVHQTNDVVARVSRLPRLLGAVQQLIGDGVYVHQSKVNVKAPFAGDQWEWHQDYINWLRCDGIDRPDLVNVAVFLDEVNEFNGPLTFIRASHTEGILAGSDNDGMPAGYEEAPSWTATLTATEKYQIRHDVIADLANRGGLVNAKGPAGSVLLFHPNVLHASAPNISPFTRGVLLLVYNTVRNPPRASDPRPDFLAARDLVALAPLP
ncbi:phytanoyl-CoA dioxygenase family protein [Plantactinospora sp. KLBMP9567]|uniref:phytanoyl-CoA dioxygenase family protein n=1 Tax=Plantactinospora sp. KLBMP9567 TaxID=3085900 RepID=UPI0029829E9D|nr:phytanoyl-CoA dioxygenase family protein [Plantactinospora sp. KLBMP9567]MDW5329511.1 phytanoyl-CoA dioxygenase family protein [Plantactinospora sp. KLBMP9567]